MKLFAKLLLSLSITTHSLSANSLSTEMLHEAITALEVLGNLKFIPEVVTEGDYKEALEVHKKLYIEALKKDGFYQQMLIREIRETHNENPFISFIREHNDLMVEIYFKTDDEVQEFCNDALDKPKCLRAAKLIKEDYHNFRLQTTRAFFYPF